MTRALLFDLDETLMVEARGVSAEASNPRLHFLNQPAGRSRCK